MEGRWWRAEKMGRLLKVLHRKGSFFDNKYFSDCLNCVLSYLCITLGKYDKKKGYI